MLPGPEFKNWLPQADELDLVSNSIFGKPYKQLTNVNKLETFKVASNVNLSLAISHLEYGIYYKELEIKNNVDVDAIAIKLLRGMNEQLG